MSLGPPKAMPAKLPPKLAPMAPTAAVGAASGKKFSASAPEKRFNQRVALYGTGGVGKTSLALRAPGPVMVLDLDGSVDVIKESLPQDLPVKIVRGIESWSDLREALHDPPLWAECQSIVLDTASRAEELAIQHVMATVPTDKGGKAQRMEDYSFGKGKTFVFDTMMQLFGDLDQHYVAGRNVIIVCHDNASRVPNPAGEDFLRWEPRMQGSDKCNLRYKLKEWVDHLLFVGYDVYAEDGKARGSGTRTIYPQEQAYFMAKSRLLSAPIPYPAGDTALWQALFSPAPF